MPEVKDVAPAQDTRLNVPTEENLGTKEHVDAALQKANDGTDPNKVAKLFAGKFKSREEMLKGIGNAADKAGDDSFLEGLYKTLEKRIGTPPAQRTGDPPTAGIVPSVTGPKPDEPSSGAADKPVDKPGETPKPIDFDALAHEFAGAGGLSSDSYQNLAKAGFDKAMVDTYLEGIRSTTNKMYDRVGGKDKYTKMLEWGVTNLPEAEQQAFDKGVSGGGEAERNLAIDGMWTRYTRANGNPPIKRLTPEGNTDGAGFAGFRSTAELTQAMRDSRYGKDPAYEKEILARLKVSKI